VELRPEILKSSQEYIQQKFGTAPNGVNFVFHGGSGSEKEKITEAIGYGAVKMNIDTDMQWAFWEGIKNYYEAKKGYLQSQIGNPDGDDVPNKKFYDPRVWLREGEKMFIKRLQEAFADLNAINRNV
jgi:fructose-bisphosphate aldolase class II